MNRPPFLSSLLPWLLLVSSCTSPPKPPAVDESRRRPANAAAEIELQTCRSDLQNTRILAAEHQRDTEVSRQAMFRAIQQQHLLVASIESAKAAQRNLLVPVLFAFGSAQVTVPEADANRIVEQARDAPLIVLRGRTDGQLDSPAEGSIARRRAEAVEAWLVYAGIDAARIRTTWQPVGDHAADNATAGGRTLNRRVEIEIYRSAPVVTTAGASSAAPAPQ